MLGNRMRRGRALAGLLAAAVLLVVVPGVFVLSSSAQQQEDTAQTATSPPAAQPASDTQQVQQETVHEPDENKLTPSTGPAILSPAKEYPLPKPKGLGALAEPAPTNHTAATQQAHRMRLLRTPPTAEYQQAMGVFEDKCSSCHGKNGYGEGPWHTEFEPEPANISLVNDSPDMLKSIVLGGVPGTMMPAFPDTPNETIQNIFLYLALQPRDLSNQWEFPWVLDAKLGKEMQKPQPEVGKQHYLSSCSGCHGAKGEGDGIMAQSEYIWPKPANLTARNSDIGRIYFFISEGRKGTFMAYNKDKLPEEARWRLAQYVLSLYNKESHATMRQPEGQIPQLTNPHLRTDRNVAEYGRVRYGLWCAPCHGGEGRGTFLAPRLIDRYWKYGGGTDTAVFTVVKEGIPGKLMLSFQRLPENERWGIITFLRYKGGLPEWAAGAGKPYKQATGASMQQGEPPGGKQQPANQQQSGGASND